MPSDISFEAKIAEESGLFEGRAWRSFDRINADALFQLDRLISAAETAPGESFAAMQDRAMQVAGLLLETKKLTTKAGFHQMERRAALPIRNETMKTLDNVIADMVGHTNAALSAIADRTLRQDLKTIADLATTAQDLLQELESKSASPV